MPKFIQKFILYLNRLLMGFSSFFKLQKAGILTFIFSFTLVFVCLYTVAQRGLVAKKIRAQLPIVIDSLNEIGLDIAYDSLKFNPIAFFPIMKIDNFQLYTLSENDYWNLQFDQLQTKTAFWGSSSLKLNFSDHGQIIFNNSSHQLNNSRTSLEITGSRKLQTLLLRTQNFNIQNFADIKEASLAIKSLEAPKKALKGYPSYKLVLSINDVNINSSRKYPLSSTIKRLSLKSELIGDFQFNDNLLASVENWVEAGGFLDISQLIVQWPPLTLVGRGQLNLRQNLQPELSFNTSSKGLIKLIKGLQEISFLNNSNVYVANILLSNKAFRLDPQDTELTITTPISYSDGRISIENLVIKDFNQETQQ